MPRHMLLTLFLASACADWDVLSDAPIPVSLVDPDWRDGEDNSREVGLEAAIALWNEAAQGQLFVYEGRDNRARGGRINVLDEDPPEGHRGSMRRVYYKTGDRLRRIDIRIKQPSLNTLAHELGHAIGLDHNVDPASVMAVPAGLAIATDDAEYASNVAAGASR